MNKYFLTVWLCAVVTLIAGLAAASNIVDVNDGKKTMRADVRVSIYNVHGDVVKEYGFWKYIAVDDDSECQPKFDSWWEREGKPKVARDWRKNATIEISSFKCE